jgi:hypothetical protein
LGTCIIKITMKQARSLLDIITKKGTDIGLTFKTAEEKETFTKDFIEAFTKTGYWLGCSDKEICQMLNEMKDESST